MTIDPPRCPWAGTDPLMIAYHDREWGVPCHDDRELFERLTLEGFQAGLSWRTILHKRAAFRLAFAEFDPERVAAFDATDVERLLAEPGIVRNRAKIAATIRNAAAFLAIQREHGSFDRYLQSFVNESSPTLSPPPMTVPLPHLSLRCAQPRPEAARLQLCRQHDLLRLYAECRHGQRPRRPLRPRPLVTALSCHPGS